MVVMGLFKKPHHLLDFVWVLSCPKGSQLCEDYNFGCKGKGLPTL